MCVAWFLSTLTHSLSLKKIKKSKNKKLKSHKIIFFFNPIKFSNLQLHSVRHMCVAWFLSTLTHSLSHSKYITKNTRKKNKKWSHKTLFFFQKICKPAMAFGCVICVTHDFFPPSLSSHSKIYIYIFLIKKNPIKFIFLKIANLQLHSARHMCVAWFLSTLYRLVGRVHILDLIVWSFLELFLFEKNKNKSSNQKQSIK